MTKIPFEDGVKVTDAKVTIDGTDYTVTPAQYSGTTPFSSYNLNQMQDNIENEINTVNNKLKAYIGYSVSPSITEYPNNSIQLDVSQLPIAGGYHIYSYYEIIYKADASNLKTTKYFTTGKIPAGRSCQLMYIDRSLNFYFRDFEKYTPAGQAGDWENIYYGFSTCTKKTISGTTTTENSYVLPIKILLYP